MKIYLLHSIALCLVLLSITDIFTHENNITSITYNDKMRKRNIDIKHLALALKFDWAKKQAYGTAAITFSPLLAARHITLDAGKLTLNSITTSRGAQLTFDYDGSDSNDALRISLDREYNSDEDITIVIDYHTNWVNNTDPMNIWGSNGKGLRFFEPSSTEPNRRRQIWSMGEPESNRYWFPCYDSPEDLRTGELNATVESGMTAISNGTLKGRTVNPDGTITFHWSTDTPAANHLSSIVVGEYSEVRQQYEDIELISYGYPDEKEGVEASVVMLPEMIKYFSEVTGLKYPFKSYSQVFAQELPAWVGNNTVSLITENMIDDYSTHADFFYLWDQTEAEALASQWFGNHITCSSWAHVWLNRSFAHYFNQLFNEQKNGKDEFLLYQRTWDQSTYHWDWDGGIKIPVVNPAYDDAFSFVNDNYTNFHGASVLHMLRKHLGEEKWWKAIKIYCKNNGGKIVTTNEFQKAVEETAGEPMGWFFDQWVYGVGHPIFEIEKQYDASTKQLTITVFQKQKKDTAITFPQAEYFKGRVDIEIDNKIMQVWVDAKEKNIYTFPLSNEPKLVNFDYESTWIKKLTFKKPIKEFIYQFENDTDVLGRSFAMTELVAFARDGNTTIKDKELIYSAFRNVIESNIYWRMRFNALSQLRNMLTNAADPNPADLNEETINMLHRVIEKDSSWVLTSAVTFLGMTRNTNYADIYIKGLSNKSERVVNACAIALGKCKSPEAFDELIKLKDKPSWKNQSLISALNGLKELGDPRGSDLALIALTDSRSPHWTLAIPVWDHRLAAAETLRALGFNSRGYELVIGQFKKAMEENNINDIFYNVVCLIALADPRAEHIFDLLTAKFAGDPAILPAVEQYRQQFLAAIKNK